ncbi:MAG: hypothetical protein U0R80_16370 [Nocardioidaceae bacterium]
MTDEKSVPEEAPAPSPGSDEAPVPPAVDATAPAAVAPALPMAAAAPRVRWQDRVLRLPAVIGVALATLVMGGFGGLGVGAIATHWRDRHDGFDGRHMMGPGGWGRDQGGPGQFGPGQMGPGQMGPGWRWNDGDQGGTQVAPSAPPTPDSSGSNG